MAIIRAQNAQYNGVSAGVQFVDGVGETADAHALNYFRRHGFEIDDEAVAPAELDWTEAEDPLKMTVPQLRAYATENSIDLGDVSRKDDILAVVLGPGAPTGVTGTPGDTLVSVAWTDPAHKGSNITGYEVIAYEDGAEIGREEAASSPYSFEGLTNGTEYTFAVRAKSAYGWGPDSAESDPITPTGG